ncbi:MAG TPA: hypothetical protein VEC01_06670 [Noviherbaspirillum sp.]|uniref:hypothetical protein n=1 Tax=Noviherbaspirillum sp. TaxID=1926288 RepID=UPI002D7339CE|nr:hypothetical protein [Noviherbaspirillum sp.]HYD94991.1 hypothetical protein [Noviherbaspirillum sp.]
MSQSFQPRCVPSEVISRWPAMALSLWKRSFWNQASILLAVALVSKFFPAWSTFVGFLLAPSLFIVSVTVVKMADERSVFSWLDCIELVLPGVLRLGRITLQFAAGFGLLIGALAWLASTLAPAGSADPFALPPAAASRPDGLAAEFLHFCATWTEGVMAMVFLGMFIVAIYQGVFGAILHAQEGICARESRRYGWQAWQVNSGSIEQALREAPAAFWQWLAAAATGIACAFQTVYLSPVGLLLATYVPCLAYVAYRSIFLGKHENVPAAARAGSVNARWLALA